MNHTPPISRPDAAITLRALEPSDLDRLYLWENNPELWQFGITRAPYSRHQLWEYISNYDADPLRSGQLRLVICAGNCAVGIVDLYDIDPRNRNAHVGIMIAPPFRRRGYASAALSQIGTYAGRILGLRTLAATVSTANKASMSLFTGAGFRQCGTLPGWLHCPDGSFADAGILTLPL